MRNEMNKITISNSLGECDHNIPVELAYEAYESLGTDSNDEYLQIFNNSVQSPSFEETQDSVNIIKKRKCKLNFTSYKLILFKPN